MSEAARRSLEELEASILFVSDFPKRRTCTYPQHVELLKARAANLHAPGLEAIDRARDQFDHLRNLVDRIGQERYEPGVPILARLWKDCALQPVSLQHRNARGVGRAPVIYRGSGLVHAAYGNQGGLFPCIKRGVRISRQALRDRGRQPLDIGGRFPFSA